MKRSLEYVVPDGEVWARIFDKCKKENLVDAFWPAFKSAKTTQHVNANHMRNPVGDITACAEIKDALQYAWNHEDLTIIEHHALVHLLQCVFHVDIQTVGELAVPHEHPISATFACALEASNNHPLLSHVQGQSIDAMYSAMVVAAILPNMPSVVRNFVEFLHCQNADPTEIFIEVVQAANDNDNVTPELRLMCSLPMTLENSQILMKVYSATQTQVLWLAQAFGHNAQPLMFDENKLLQIQTGPRNKVTCENAHVLFKQTYDDHFAFDYNVFVASNQWNGVRVHKNSRLCDNAIYSYPAQKAYPHGYYGTIEPCE